jgi:hypothetical protein
MTHYVNPVKGTTSTPKTEVSTAKKDTTKLYKPSFTGWSVRSTQDALIDIRGEDFVAYTKWQVKHPAEIAGYMVVDENMRTQGNWLLGEGSSAGVTVEANQKIKVMLEIDKAGFDYPNVQWHTHYGFGPYFSAVDDSAQKQLVMGEKISIPFMIYLCFDQFSGVARKFDFKTMEYTDGRISIDGQLLPGKKTSSITSYSTYDYGDYYYGYGYGNYTARTKTNVQSASVNYPTGTYGEVVSPDYRGWDNRIKCYQCPFQDGCGESYIVRLGQFMPGKCSSGLSFQEVVGL